MVLRENGSSLSGSQKRNAAPPTTVERERGQWDPPVPLFGELGTGWTIITKLLACNYTIPRCRKAS